MFNTAIGERILTGDEAILFKETIVTLVDSIIGELELDVDCNLGCGVFDTLTPAQKLWCVQKVTRCLLVEDEPVLPKAALYESTCGAMLAHLKGLIEIELNHQQYETEPEAVCTEVRQLVSTVVQQAYPDESWPLAECVLFDEWELAIDAIQIRIIPDEDWKAEPMHLDSDPEQIQVLRAFQGIEEDYFMHIPPDNDDIDVPALAAELRTLCSVM